MQRQRDSSAGELTYSSTALIEIYSEQPSLLCLQALHRAVTGIRHWEADRHGKLLRYTGR